MASSISALDLCKANVLMLYAGLELKASDLNLITWSRGRTFSVALINSSLTSSGLQRVSLRMFAQGDYVVQQDSELDCAGVVEKAIGEMLTGLQECVAEFATILEECDDVHMHVHIPANSDNPSCRYDTKRSQKVFLVDGMLKTRDYLYESDLKRVEELEAHDIANWQR